MGVEAIEPLIVTFDAGDTRVAVYVYPTKDRDRLPPHHRFEAEYTDDRKGLVVFERRPLSDAEVAATLATLTAGATAPVPVR